MSSLFRCPGFDEVEEVSDAYHYEYLMRGWIYIGPVPDEYDEPDTIKPLKKKRKSPDVE